MLNLPIFIFYRCVIEHKALNCSEIQYVMVLGKTMVLGKLSKGFAFQTQ